MVEKKLSNIWAGSNISFGLETSLTREMDSMYNPLDFEFEDSIQICQRKRKYPIGLDDLSLAEDC